MTRKVLVIGGANGIGAGIAVDRALAGDEVVVADIDQGALAALLAQSREGLLPPLGGMEVDVTDETSVNRLFALHPEVTAVVNAVGVYPNVPVEQMALSDWQQVIDVNLTGSFLVGRAAARLLRAAGGPGRLVFISSGAATSARVGASHYCASKAGLDMLMRVLALELAHTGVTVNAVAPGLIEVDRLGDLDPVYVETLVGDLPVPRIGTPADVAAAVRFLLSDDAAYVTGSVMTVDGGYAAGRGLPASHRNHTHEREDVS